MLKETPTPDAAFPELGIGDSVVIIGAIIAILAAFGYLIQVGIKTSEKKKKKHSKHNKRD